MPSRLMEILEDSRLIDKIKGKLPYLFALAELDASRAGKIGMEVGSLREKILIALLIYKFGQENVDVRLPITEPEADVILFGYPISIKTITGEGGVKAVWTVNAQSAREFIYRYRPRADILLAQIKWNDRGALYFIPLEAQKALFKELGTDRYFKLPKVGTNPRGVEFSKGALLKLRQHDDTKEIKIFWTRDEAEISPYKAYERWLDYWEEE